MLIDTTMARTKATAKKNVSRLPTTSADKLSLAVRKHRKRPGTKALQEIRRYQKGTECLIPKQAIKRCIQEVAQNVCLDKNLDQVSFTKNAMEALQTASEDYLIELADYSMRFALHSKRKTLMMPDLKLATQLLNVIYKCDSK